MSKHSSTTNNEVISALEVLGFDETRGVIGTRAPDGVTYEKLTPTLNEVVILHVRFPNGEPFCVTVDGATFARVNQPLLNGILKKSEELRDSRSRISVAPKATP